MHHSAAWLAAAIRAGALRPVPSTRRLAGDLGEGVISAAIAVLIVAFLGAAMWLVFQTLWGNIQVTTCAQMEQIGSGGVQGGAPPPPTSRCPT